ncbi:hypothetical protein ACJX0J_037096, partial [Zea mays]
LKTEQDVDRVSITISNLDTAQDNLIEIEIKNIDKINLLALFTVQYISKKIYGTPRSVRHIFMGWLNSLWKRIEVNTTILYIINDTSCLDLHSTLFFLTRHSSPTSIERSITHPCSLAVTLLKMRIIYIARRCALGGEGIAAQANSMQSNKANEFGISGIALALSGPFCNPFIEAIFYLARKKAKGACLAYL